MRGQVNIKANRSTSTPIIGVDVLGSDTPAHELLDAVLLFATQNPKAAHFVVFAQDKDFQKAPSLPSISFVSVPEFISMDEDPLKALKQKSRSSIVAGIRQLKEKQIDAFISFGNTGALLACATLSLDLLEGISRPALLATIPTQKDPLAILDVGANLSVTAKQLEDFAKIGSAYQKCSGKIHPKVGLLNIGAESSKGTATLKEAYEKLSSLKNGLEFVGNIEARDLFKGNVDVVVADGFSGNIFLKTAEGLGEMILSDLENLPSTTNNDRALLELKEKLTYSKYPGALLAGLDGLVIKCHGIAHPSALISSLQKAISLITENFLSQLREHLK